MLTPPAARGAQRGAGRALIPPSYPTLTLTLCLRAGTARAGDRRHHGQLAVHGRRGRVRGLDWQRQPHARRLLHAPGHAALARRRRATPPACPAWRHACVHAVHGAQGCSCRPALAAPRASRARPRAVVRGRPPERREPRGARRGGGAGTGTTRGTSSRASTRSTGAGTRTTTRSWVRAARARPRRRPAPSAGSRECAQRGRRAGRWIASAQVIFTTSFASTAVSCVTV
jgi:hypothetical protein